MSANNKIAYALTWVFRISVVILALCVIYLIFTVAYAIMGSSSAPSAGIIGGADGPTFLFLVDRTLRCSPVFTVGCIALVISALSGAWLLIARIKNKQSGA